MPPRAGVLLAALVATLAVVVMPVGVGVPATATGPSAAAAAAAATGTPGCSAGVPATAVTMPLRRLGARLVDQNGAAFQVRGDSAWSLIVQLQDAQVVRYLDARRAQGFNTLLVNLIEHAFSDNPPANAYGQQPFLRPGDFTTPNPAYFDQADDVLRMAQERGFAVLLAPAYIGWQGGSDGWYQEMVAAGPAAMRQYGQYLGSRYRGFDNIVWVMGGDWTPPAAGLALIDALQAGIAERDERHPFSAHWRSETSGSEVAAPWLDLDTTYTYDNVHVKSTQDYLRRPDLPRIMLESGYEAGNQQPTLQRVRAQAYDALLTGALGHLYGHRDTWQFTPAWPSALGSPGACAMEALAALFAPLACHALVPDTGRALLTSGRGFFGDDDYAVGAYATGEVAVAYVPTVRTVEVSLAHFSAPVRARWYDPTNGTWRAAAGAPLPPGGAVSMTSPGPNAGGDGDWVLVLDEGATPACAGSSPPADRTPPVVVMRRPTATYTLSTSLSPAWSATDLGSGVASYDARYIRITHTGAGGTAVLPPAWQATTATSRTLQGATRGATYCFAARARDAAGNVSAWSAQRCTAVPLDDRSLRPAGGWTRLTGGSFLHSTVTRTRSQGAVLTLPVVSARRIAVVATTCPSCGSVSVELGGTRIRTVSLVSATVRHRVVLPVLSSSTLRTGALSIRVTSPTGRRVYVDGVGLSRT